MSNMMSDFLSSNGLTAEDVVKASKKVERWGDADRTLASKRSHARRTKKPYAELELGKPQGLGRGLRLATVNKALSGAALPRIARKKIVRAVNECLTSKKKDPIEWRQLFSDVHIKGYKPKAAE